MQGIERPVWRVLIVDKDQKNFEDTRDMLNWSHEWQFDLKWASSFNAGKQKLSAEQFDAVLIDYDLQTHTGLELIQELVSQGYAAPLILLTERDLPGIDDIALQSGASQHLTRSEATPLLLERTIRYAIERKQSEEELKRSEQRFSKAFQGSPDAMIISRLSDLVILEVNESFERIFGFTSEEVVGKASFEFNLFVNPAARRKSIELLQAQGYLRNFEIEVRTRSDDIRTVNLSIESITIHGEEHILTIGHDITDRKQMEMALRTSEERYRTFFQHLPNIVVLLEAVRDEQGRMVDWIITDANDAALKIIGLNRDIITGRQVASAMDASAIALRMDFFREALEKGVTANYEATYKDRRYLASAFLMNSDTIAVIGLDITQQKQAEEAARESEARFQDLANNISQLAWMADEKGQIFWYNQRWFDYTGTHLEDVIGLGWQKVLHPDHVQRVAEKMRQSFEAGEFWEDTFLMRNKDEQYRWFLSRAVPIRDRNGKVVRWFGTNTDITEQREIVAALRESEERFRVALEYAPIVVFSLDCELRFTWIYNPIMGLSTSDILGKRTNELWAPDDVKELTTFLQQVLDNHNSKSEELHIPTGGEWEYSLITAKPTFDENGDINGLIGAAMDVSEIRRLQAQQVENESRVKAQHLLMEYREQERMQLARILHDEPLQSLIAAQMELSQVDIPPEDSSVSNLETTNELLRKTINNIRMLALDLRPPTLMHLGLSKAMRAYIDTFRERNPNIQVKEELLSDHEVLPEDVRLTLYRVFQELMNNIAKHAQATGIFVKLTIETDQVLLEVKDNGKGFEPPKQWIDLATGGHLGLVGIYERLEVIHGHLEIESLPGDGTYAKVSVPLQRLILHANTGWSEPLWIAEELMDGEQSIRCITPADIQAVFELELAYARAFPGALVIPAEAYLSPGFHHGADVFCAFQDERLAAYAPVYVQPIENTSQNQPQIAWAEIKVYPELAAPWTVKDALLERIIERARAITRECGLPRKRLQMTFDYRTSEKHAIAYVQSHGFGYVQSAFLMTRDLSEQVPESPLPERFALRRWKMESEPDQRSYVEARNQCFPRAPISLENWKYYMKSNMWESGTTIACFLGDELVGNVNVYWNEEEIRAKGKRSGYTEDIFVRPGWRGKGIARSMICEGMRYLQENDMAEARLTVAAQNETALGLYRGLGYKVIQESQQYSKSIEKSR